MDLVQAITTRRSVRAYTDRPVDRATVERLLAAAVQAPSATNSQPWSFAVIQDSDLLKTYSDRAKAHLLGRIDQTPALAKYSAMLANPAFNIFYNARTLVVIWARPEGPHPEGDCCLAAQNFMLAAHDLGLGTCWIGFAVVLLNLPEVKLELGIPAEYTAVAPLILGYPETTPPTIAKNAPQIICWR
jgi:nitroreductase